MAVLSHTVTKAQSGCTLRELLIAHWHISSSLRKALRQREGAVLCNGQPIRMNAVLREGDFVQIDVSDSAGSGAPVQPVDFPLSILWEDEHLLALDKPSGITVHGAALTDEAITIAGAAAYYLGSTSVHVVNRLDRGTSGVMLIAKNGYMHHRCMELMHTQALQRQYRAVCDGVPTPSRGIIDAPIGRDITSLLRRCIDPAGQAAVTEYEVLSVHDGRALVRLLPHTGRTHQLRVHMAHLGCPLTGDWLYGTENRALIARPALHSHILHFVHPLTGQVLRITAPLPEDMARLIHA